MWGCVNDSSVNLWGKFPVIHLSRSSSKICLFLNFGFIYIFFILWGGTKSLGTAATSGLLYKPQMIDEDNCGAIGGMEIGRGNRSTQRKPAPAPLCPSQIPHDQTPARTRAAVGSQRLTAWAMARPLDLYKKEHVEFSQLATAVLLRCETTYLCETIFSAMAVIRSK
jgi:hypothetical protein